MHFYSSLFLTLHLLSFIALVLILCHGKCYKLLEMSKNLVFFCTFYGTQHNRDFSIKFLYFFTSNFFCNGLSFIPNAVTINRFYIFLYLRTACCLLLSEIFLLYNSFHKTAILAGMKCDENIRYNGLL